MLPVHLIAARIAYPDLSAALPMAAEAAADPSAPLAQYGAVGVVCTAAISAFWWMVRRSVERADRIENQARDDRAAATTQIAEERRAHATELRELHAGHATELRALYAVRAEEQREVATLIRDAQQLVRDLAKGAPPDHDRRRN